MIRKILQLFLILIIVAHETVSARSLPTSYKKIYRLAEIYFLNENYITALPLYLKLDSMKNNNANVNFKIGYCYLNSSGFKTLSIPYFEKASNSVSEDYVEYSIKEKRAPQSTYSYLAKAYQLDYKFDDAIATYKIYKGILGTNPNFSAEVADIDHDIETCKNAKQMVETPTRYRVTNLGEGINSPYADYSPVVSLDEKTLIFTSRRPDGTGGKKELNGQYFEDIYVSNYENDSWGKAISIGPNINTDKNEATVNLSADGQNLLIYEDVNGGDIYLSEKWKGLWGLPKPLDEKINSPYWETHACFNTDNSILYFVSDRPGGFGGRDIYKCLRLPNGLWSSPQNLGANINSIYDEDGVFVHPNGKEIYWSSKGHNTMGGFDIFSSKIDDENGFWSAPVNMGYPINSPDDDVFFVVTADGKRAYFSSDKKGGYGEKDIYRIDFRDNMPEALTLLKGIVTLNKDAPSGALGTVEIIVTDVNSGIVVQTVKPNLSTGKYLLLLSSGTKGKTFNINYTAESCKDPINLSMTVDPDSSFQEINRSVKLQIFNYDNFSIDTLDKSIITEEAKGIPGIFDLGTPNIANDNKIDTLISSKSIANLDSVPSLEVSNIINTSKSEMLNSSKSIANIDSVTNLKTSKVNKLDKLNNSLDLGSDTSLKELTIVKVIKRDDLYSPETKFEIGTKIDLGQFLYDSGNPIYLNVFEEEFNELFKLMKTHPELTIEISGHTDSSGTVENNLKLSKIRSQSIVDALVKKGIPKNHLVSKGYGSTKPIASNTLPNGKPNQIGMKLNRRVELRIIKSVK